MSGDAADRSMRVDVPAEDALTVVMSGRWTSVHDTALPQEVLQQVTESTRRVDFDAAGISAWDSTLLTFVRGVNARCARRGVAVGMDGLPDGVQRLLGLASAVPEHDAADHPHVRARFITHVGNRVIAFCCSAGEMLAFLGECLLSARRLLRGKAVFRQVDLWLLTQEAGAHALPIVSLISVLVGLILAFVGAYQLRAFGAEIYVAMGVALGMVREMAPMMTGILLAGRTGAAFAAQIGTMRVNEETDALETMGISTFDFLVMPRVLALGMMMPMLCLYSILMGIAGAAVVSASMFGIPLAQYFEETWKAVSCTDLAVGIVKSAIFGVVVAAAGCMRGMQSGRSASAVGDAATSAVVTGIVSVVVIDSVAAVISTVFGF